MRFYKQYFLCGAAVLALGNFSLATAQSLSEQDQKFIQDAAKGGMMEVHMGQLGTAARGESSREESFAAPDQRPSGGQ